jgi:chromosomal replication initiation ATPase DnaA
MKTDQLLNHVFDAVQDTTGISYRSFSGKSRLRPIVTARQIFAYICWSRFGNCIASPKNENKTTLQQVGRFMGGRGHATVINSRRKALLYIETEPKYRELVEKVETKIEQQ